ncbi:MAG TPA: cytochrome P450 [Streptosporangiaceae bacterium]|nr:cytochrome P450 [Streptosporangiaceae bacterium]
MTTMTLPDGPSAPRFVQGATALTAPLWNIRRLHRRYGPTFTVDVPIFGKAVVISDPADVRQLFMTSPEIADNLDVNLGRVLGPNSFFAITGDRHKKQRKLLTPPFHGRRVRAYEAIVEQEAVREMATWPQGRAFPTLAPMMRITLNAILRAVFGADGADLAELRQLIPAMVTLGARLAVLPIPRTDLGRWSPWGRALAYRRQYDEIVDRLIEAARQDPRLDGRDDVLALMLQSKYDDGSPMTRDEIADQLLTLLTAGHETTATTLAWAVERLRRHPEMLRRLVAEADAGGSELREATILEVQRTRPVVDRTARQVHAPSMELGRWTLPKGQIVMVSIYLMHNNAKLFPDPGAFDPDRFAGKRPDTYEWIPFGGGVRRCIGAAFASMEMNVVLRTLLRDVTLAPTGDRGERWHSRGITWAPAKGGLAVISRRSERTDLVAPKTTARSRG